MCENDYLYASSLVRASEGGGSAGERLERILSSTNAESLRKNAAEIFGVEEKDTLEAVLESALLRCTNTLRSAVPYLSVFAPLLYKYDCNNIKIALKSALLGINCKNMLSGAGTVDPHTVAKCAETGDFGKIPLKMANAAKNARKAYLETGEARAVDILLDCACFEDMKEAAEKGSVPLISEIVSATADKVNLLIYLRVQRMNMPEDSAKMLISRALVTGGKIPLSAFSKDTEYLKNNLGDCIFKKTFAEIDVNALDFTVVERIFDDIILSLVSDVKFIAFGPEVPLRYLAVCEAEIQNCRVMARCLAKGMDKADARERMRCAYV